MKRFVLFVVSALIVTFLFSDCKGPKRVGKKIGKIECKRREINDEYTKIQKQLNALDENKNGDREEMEDLKLDLWDLEGDMADLGLKMHKLQKAELKQFGEEKKDYDKWVKERDEAVKEYIKDNCYDKQLDGRN